MSVLRRDLRGHLKQHSDLFQKVLVFHHVKHGSVIIAMGLNADGSIFGARAGFSDTHVTKDSFFDMDPDTFWALLAFDDVVEIDPSDWTGLQKAAEQYGSNKKDR